MLIAGIIVLGAGGVLCLLGLIFKLSGKNHCTKETQGIVVGMCMNAYSFNNGGSGNIGMLVSSGSASTGTRCPVFEYHVNGITYRRASSVAYNCSLVSKMLNQSRTVYYNPKQPEQASLSKHSVLGILGNVFLPIGIALVLLGIIFLFADIR